MTWAQWQQADPDGWVLSRDNGVTRDYGANPYGGYDQVGSDLFRNTTGGGETVPTVIVGSRALVNPCVARVVSAVRAEFPDQAESPVLLAGAWPWLIGRDVLSGEQAGLRRLSLAGAGGFTVATLVKRWDWLGPS